jgi:hypothetical protein
VVGMAIGGWVSCCQVADSGRVIEVGLQELGGQVSCVNSMAASTPW